MTRTMDIEFHYYINYIIALKVGLLPEVAEKIAYSAQYVDDNTQEYTILQRHNLNEYKNIITQSINPLINTKNIIDIFPIFHFVPGNDILHTSLLRRDGLCRHMTTTPNNKLAKNCLKNAIKENNPYWIGIASHAYVDTWAHQNFTGLKDIYNAVNIQQTNYTKFLGSIEYIGHSDVMNLPDNPNTIWYDFRLKDMKVNNIERFLEAAKNLFFIYYKYIDSSMFVNKPINLKIAWQELYSILMSILKSDFAKLTQIYGENCGMKSKTKFTMSKILGINQSQRIELYMNFATMYNQQYSHCKYNKNKWIHNAFYEVSNTIQDYTANDNYTTQQFNEDALYDSAENTTYYYDDIKIVKNKICNLLQKKIYMWKNFSNDWLYFQEAAKKHYAYMMRKILPIMRKDIAMMRK